MNVTEKEVTTTQKIYELTEQELKELKDEYFNKGINIAREYILYCVANTEYKMNLWWIRHFTQQLIDFVKYESGYIENKNKVGFQDFVYGKR